MPQLSGWFVTTFYRFIKFENPEAVSAEWTAKAQSLGIFGLVILAPEGFNTTCCARDPKALEAFKEWVVQRFACPDLMFKDSVCEKAPFPRFKVKIRDEIVTLDTPDLVPEGNHRHLSPAEWDRTLREDDVVVLDTRNWYETRIGTFKNAVDPKIEQFTDFPKFVEDQNYSKDQKMLIFCTGGIRCEKAILDLERRGYDNVFQLEGGILNYIEKFPNGEFEGECFVFDNRVALDQKLQPSKVYTLCPHCGQPADIHITCERCETPAQICVNCHGKHEVRTVCSKNCAHHNRLAPGKKGRPQL